jgi:hypothetical protein
MDVLHKLVAGVVDLPHWHGDVERAAVAGQGSRHYGG